jgi:Flp pilus assembly protein TadG
MVEFAVALPLLLILVLGIIEFGFVLAQMNEIRHGAREGARYAAVSRPDYDGGGGVGDNADVIAATCDAIALPGTTVSVISRTGSRAKRRIRSSTSAATMSTSCISSRG